MKNILIIGKNSFVAKNFIENYNYKLNLFYFDRYFRKKDLNFSKILIRYIKKNKINFILNFAGNNNNSLYHNNFDKVLESNFYLPLILLKVASKLKISLFLFLSKDMNDNNKIKNFYALSKEMLNVYIDNNQFDCKLRILTIDSLYGPFDLNENRIFPSIFKNLHNKKKIKINLSQIKNFTYVKDLNKIILNLISRKQHLIFKVIKSEKINIKFIFNFLKKQKNKMIKNKSSKYQALFFTSEWYKKHYEKK